MSEVRLRVVSDLHFAEPGSRLHDLGALRPVFDGAEKIVLNGDSVETRFVDIAPHTREHAEAFKDFVAGQRDRVTVITGNHDPDISSVHHLELEEGRILITHGDVIFPEMAPWGWESRYFRIEQERRLALLAEGMRTDWEARLRICKEAVLAIRDLSPRYPGRSSHPWRRRMRFLLTPRRIDRILRAWKTAPDRCVAMAETYRPHAKLILFGHTHCPGVWEQAGRTLINTGSLVPPLGACVVDFVGRRVEVRRLSFRRGELRPGELRTELDLDVILARSPIRTATGGGQA